MTIFLGTAVLLGGCHKATSGANGASTAPAGVDPCTLVTRADAERLLGKHVEPAIRGDSGPVAVGHDCIYVTTATGDSASGTWGIGLTVYDDADMRRSDLGFMSAAEYFRRTMVALRSSGSRFVAVPGLGAEAFWQRNSNLLHIFDNDVYVVLDVDVEYHAASGSSEAGDARLETEKRTAEIALARDVILPRLAHAASLSIRRPPHGGT